MYSALDKVKVFVCGIPEYDLHRLERRRCPSAGHPKPVMIILVTIAIAIVALFLIAARILR